MTDILLPPYLYPDDESVEVVDRTSTVFRPEFAAGVVQRQEQSAPILRVTQKYSGMSTSDRGALLAFVRQTRGRVNGIWLTPLRYSLRGSFPASELLTNNTFANGTTGWLGVGSALPTLTVSDRVARLTQGLGFSGNANELDPAASLSLTQYAPYVIRCMFLQGSGNFGSYVVRFGPTAGSNAWAELAILGNSSKLISVAGTALATSGYPAFVAGSSAGDIAGVYGQIQYVSLSRCALVDNGPNFISKSDQFDDASWTKSAATITANNSVAPDGTTTGDDLVETAVTAGHFVNSTAVTVPSAAGDYALSVCIKPLNRSWAILQIQENTGPSSCLAYFNISTGAIGTTTAGTNWSNLRTFVADMGNGWFKCTLIGRKTNSATSVTAFINAASANGTSSYLGVASGAITLWRATLCISSVPTRLVQTTSTTSGSTQTGSALYVKGLPVSTNGLLLPGDFLQVGNELKMITASLNSDAAGLGYLQFEPPLFRSPADNDPVIIQNPMGKFILADNSKIANRLGRYADIDMVFEELYE